MPISSWTESHTAVESSDNDNVTGWEDKQDSYELSTVTAWGYYGLGYSYELLMNPKSFILDYLYPIASKEGFAVAPTFSPLLVNLGYAPQIVVLGPYDRDALVRLFQYGEGEDNDPAAREPLDRVHQATGTVTVANMQGTDAFEQRRLIKKYLNNSQETYAETLHTFSELLEKWVEKYTYQENIRWAVTNIIAKVVFGIPIVEIGSMKALQSMSNSLANHEPTSPEFIEASQNLQNLGDELSRKYHKDIIGSNKLISEQLHNDYSLEKLFEIKAGSSILVEGNLSNTIMIALERIMSNDDIKNRLRKELQDFDFSAALSDENMLRKLTQNKYLHQVYMEALRYVQSSVMIARKTSRATEWNIKNKEGEVQHLKINAGSYFFAPLRAMGHDPNLWNNPGKFDPDRFEKTDTNEFNLNNIFPFTAGKRMCPAASQFAMLVFKTAIGEIVMNYNIKLSHKAQTIPPNSVYPILEPPMYLENVEKIKTGTVLKFDETTDEIESLFSCRV